MPGRRFVDGDPAEVMLACERAQAARYEREAEAAELDEIRQRLGWWWRLRRWMRLVSPPEPHPSRLKALLARERARAIEAVIAMQHHQEADRTPTVSIRLPRGARPGED